MGKTSLEVTAKMEGVFAQQAFAQRVANKCAHGQGVSVLFWRIVERRTCGGHPKTAKAKMVVENGRIDPPMCSSFQPMTPSLPPCGCG